MTQIRESIGLYNVICIKETKWNIYVLGEHSGLSWT